MKTSKKTGLIIIALALLACLVVFRSRPGAPRVSDVFDHEGIRRECSEAAAVFAGVLRSFPDQPLQCD